MYEPDPDLLAGESAEDETEDSIMSPIPMGPASPFPTSEDFTPKEGSPYEAPVYIPDDIPIPPDFELRESSIPGAGLGIWAKKRLEVGERVGPCMAAPRASLREADFGWEVSVTDGRAALSRLHLFISAERSGAAGGGGGSGGPFPVPRLILSRARMTPPPRHRGLAARQPRRPPALPGNVSLMSSCLQPPSCPSGRRCYGCEPGGRREERDVPDGLHAGSLLQGPVPGGQLPGHAHGRAVPCASHQAPAPIPRLPERIPRFSY